MIVVTVFLSILKQMDFHFVQNRKEYCHHDHIAFNLRGYGILVFSVQQTLSVLLCRRATELGILSTTVQQAIDRW